MSDSPLNSTILGHNPQGMYIPQQHPQQFPHHPQQSHYPQEGIFYIYNNGLFNFFDQIEVKIGIVDLKDHLKTLLSIFLLTKELLTNISHNNKI